MIEAGKTVPTLRTIIGTTTEMMTKIYGGGPEAPHKVGCPEWEWAKNKENGGRLKEELGKLRAAMSNFHTRLITESIADVKKSSSNEVQLAELKALKLLKPIIENCQEQLDTAISRKNAKVSAGNKRQKRS